jgi:predicted HicB family RNase H-like nuclease
MSKDYKSVTPFDDRLTRPLQIYFTQAEHKRLKLEATQRGMSMNELVRTAITRYLQDSL